MLDDIEAIKLFSIYAFEGSSPPKEHKEHSKWVVHYAAGLPLALKVLGSFLCGKDTNEWKSTLKRLEVVPDKKVNEILKISFDGLTEMEQKVFLDIACFFKGKTRGYATKILDSFDFCAHIGIRVLILKSLVSVSEGILCMHDLIQEMGWHIVRKVSNNPGEHSRLWLFEVVCNVLTSKMGMDAIEGIYLDLAPEQDVISFSADTFKNMLELRFLHLSYKHSFIHNTSKFDIHPYMSKSISIGTRYSPKWFSEDNLYLPSKLQWLTWKGYLLGSLPECFKGEKLVGLEMVHSHITQLWSGRKNMEQLTYINLSYSNKLRSTPDLEGTPKLMSLILHNCYNLVEVHPSLAYLKHIVFLNLNFCTSLESLPSRLHMESLETLILSDCRSLTKFPEVSDNMGTLSKLYLDSTSIVKLPESLGNLTGLMLLSLSWCLSLEKLPDSLAQVQSLEELLLDGTPIREPPSSTVVLKNLKTLSLSRCASLMSSLLITSISDSKSLLSYGFIKKLNASSCNLLEGEFPGDLTALFSLEELDLSCNPFKYLPHSICQLPRLKILYVSYCGNLEKIQRLPSTIVALQAQQCWSLTSFLGITKYETLWMLNMRGEEGRWGNSVDSVLQSLLQGHLVANHRLSILVPGDDIPKWFSQQNDGHHMRLQLPSGWCNGNILGFAICAVTNGDVYELTLGFDLIEGEMQDLKLTLPENSTFREVQIMKRQVWLGFLSIDFFKFLFPQFKEEDWSIFEGSLCVQMHHHHRIAIRPVYKNDVKEGTTTIQNSGAAAGVVTGQPLLMYDDTDVDGNDYIDYNPCGFKKERHLLCTAYMKQTGRMGAKIRFQV